MIASTIRFQTPSVRRLRTHALGTTILVSLLSTPLAAQSTLDWDAGNGTPGAALGADGIWIEGGATNLWQDGAVDAQPFEPGDTAVFGPSTGDTPYTVTVDTDVNAEDVLFDTDGVTIDGTGRLSIAGEVAVTTAGDAAEVAVEIVGDTSVGGAGDLTLSGGVDGDVTMQGSGTLSILSTIGNLTSDLGSVVIGAGADVDAATNDGADVEVTDGTVGSVTNAAGSVDISGGTIGLVRNTGGSIDIGGGAVGSVTNSSGDLEISGGSVGSVTITTGTVRVSGGSVTGTTTNNATLEMAGGALTDVTNNETAVIEGTQDIEGDFDNNGLLDASGAGAETLAVDGTFEINAGSNITTDAAGDTVNTLTVTAARIEINSNSAFNGTNDLDGSIVFEGAITNNADIDLTGDLELTGTLTNTATIDQSGSLETNGNTIEVDGGVYNLSSTATITGAGDLRLINGGNFTIAAGGTATFDVLTLLDTSFDPDAVGGVLNFNLLSNEGASTLTIDAGFSGAGAVSNAAQIDFDGGSLDRLVNTTTGIVDVNAGGAVATTVANAGDFNVNGGTFEYQTFVNEPGGALNVAIGAALATTSTDPDPSLENTAGGEATISGSVSGHMANRDGGNVSLESTAEVTRITNEGVLTINGGQIGQLANMATGDLDVTGDTSVATAVDNFGAFDLTSGTITAPGFVNKNAATFGIDGGATLDGLLENEAGGAVELNGRVTGLVTNRADGTINVTGLGGQLGASDVSLLNQGIVSIQSGAVLRSSGRFDNTSGTLNLFSGELDGDVTGGTINVRGTEAAISGTLDLAGGTIDLSEGGSGATDTTLRIGGDAVLNGTLNYELAFDADPSVESATSDRIEVSGDVSGAPVFQFNTDGSARRLNGIEVLSYGTNGGLALDQLRGFEDVREFDYFLADNGSGSIQLQSRINTGIASLAATVGLTENVVGTIINRPTSPYVADLAVDPGDEKCGFGSWSRATGGRADAEGEFTDGVSNLTSTAPVELQYAGVQLGGDLACFGGVYNGWDLAFGGIFGYNVGKSTNNVFAINAEGNPTGVLNSVTETDITQKYAGAYLTAARGRLFGDVQLRFEVTDFVSDNTAEPGREAFGIDLNDEKYQNRSQTLSGSVGYSWPLNEVGDLSFISLAGFQVSQSETDNINLGEDGELELDDKTSKLGFVSGTLAKTTIRPDNLGLLSFFGTATYYNDFSDAAQATLVSEEGNRNPFELSNLGSYGEVSAGINYVRILNPGQAGNARQFNAAVRLDARTGESVDSWGITAQMRLQF